MKLFDASEYFTLVYDEHGQLHPVVSCEDGIKKDDPNRYSLIVCTHSSWFGVNHRVMDAYGKLGAHKKSIRVGYRSIQVRLSRKRSAHSFRSISVRIRA